MINILGKEYPERLDFSKDDIKVGKGRWRFTVIITLLIISTFTTLTIVSAGTLLYAIPGILIFQFIITLFNLFTHRDRYLEKENVRQIGFAEDGSFIGSEYEKKLYLYIVEMADKLRINIPRVAIEETDEVNAYAIGPTRNKGLIVITSAFLENMSEDAALAVIAHEMGHIVNGDMRNQTFLDLFLAATTTLLTLPIKIVLYPITTVTEEYLGINLSNAIYFIVGIIMDIVVMWLLKLISLTYSRRREFRADLFAAKVVGLDRYTKLINEFKNIENPKVENATLAFFGNVRSLDIFSTHPNWDRRLKFVEKHFK
jgi:heat shock protein HtpX